MDLQSIVKLTILLARVDQILFDHTLTVEKTQIYVLENHSSSEFLMKKMIKNRLIILTIKADLLLAEDKKVYK